MQSVTGHPEVSVFRLNLLRAVYVLLGLALGAIIWPQILTSGASVPLQRTVVVSMLGAVSLLALIGIVHPLKMLPLVFFELAWKAIWLLSVALPMSQNGELDASARSIVKDCLLMVIILPAIPWRYVFSRMRLDRSEPWRSAR